MDVLIDAVADRLYDLAQPITPESEYDLWEDVHDQHFTDLHGTALVIFNRRSEYQQSIESKGLILLYDTKYGRFYTWKPFGMNRVRTLDYNDTEKLKDTARPADPGEQYVFQRMHKDSYKMNLRFYQVAEQTVRVMFMRLDTKPHRRSHPYRTENLKDAEMRFMWSCMMNDVETAMCEEVSFNHMADSSSESKDTVSEAARVKKPGVMVKNLGINDIGIAHTFRYMKQGIQRMRTEEGFKSNIMFKQKYLNDAVLWTRDIEHALRTDTRASAQILAMISKIGSDRHVIAIDVLPNHVRPVILSYKNGRIRIDELETRQVTRDKMCPIHTAHNIFNLIVNGRQRDTDESDVLCVAQDFSDIVLHHHTGGVPTYGGWLPKTVSEMYRQVCGGDTSRQRQLLDTLHGLWWRIGVMHEDAARVDGLYSTREHRLEYFFALKDVTKEIDRISTTSDDEIVTLDAIATIDIYVMPAEAIHRLLQHKDMTDALLHAKHYHTSLLETYNDWKKYKGAIQDDKIYFLTNSGGQKSDQVRCIFVLSSSVSTAASLITKLLRNAYASWFAPIALGPGMRYNIVPWAMGNHSWYALWTKLQAPPGRSPWHAPKVCNLDLKTLFNGGERDQTRQSLPNTEWLRRAVLKHEEVVLNDRVQDIYDVTEIKK